MSDRSDYDDGKPVRCHVCREWIQKDAVPLEDVQFDDQLRIRHRKCIRPPIGTSGEES